MKELFYQYRLAIANFIIVGYFALLYIIFISKINFVLLGVLIELFTIPFLIAQIVFLIIGVRALIKQNNLKKVTVLSIVILAMSTIIVVLSFFG